MDRRDLTRILIIGAAVGILIQPILANNLPARILSYIMPPVRLAIFLFFLAIAPLALWIAKLLSRWIVGLYQFAQFAAVGTLNSFIYTCVLNIQTFFYGAGALSNFRFAIFAAISFLFSTTNSFIWNKYWTFNAREKASAGEVGGFYAIALGGLILSVAAATFVKAIGPIDSRAWVNIVAPLAGIAVSFAWNFIGYKFWVFKRK